MLLQTQPHNASWRWRHADAAKPYAKWQPSAAIEGEYSRRLRMVAKEVGRICSGHGGAGSIGKLVHNLEQYAEILEPWAQQQAAWMLGRANASSKRAWGSLSKKMGRALRSELMESRVGLAVALRTAENVRLIMDLPLGAARHIQELVREAQIQGTRADALTASIMETGGKTENDARRIARTEISKASTALTQARAESIGSPGYYWRTSEDADVRGSHAPMNGVFVLWGEPPTLDGMTGHAGEFPYCRCYPEPSIPELREYGAVLYH